MLIVFDGIDCAGKTSIAAEVSKLTNVPIYERRKWPTKEKWSSLVDFQGMVEYLLLSKIDFSKVSIIVDRLVASNNIYPKFYNRAVDLSYMEEIRLNNVIEFYIRCDWETISKRYDERGDMMIPKEDLRKLYDLYEDYYENSGAIIINNSNTTIQHCAEQVVEHLRCHLK
jgi:thymidylate kinase